MKTKAFFIIPIILLILVLAVLAAGCMTPVDSNGNPGTTSSGAVEKVEVFHFHRTQQCYSCRTLGAYAEETVDTYFAPEVASGKVVFGHVNIDLPENKALVDQYGPTGSSLWIGVYDKNGFHKEENVNVWYKIGNKEEYLAYLKGVIEKRLAGDLS
ncbi:MAG TPA: nitrophenyl compound nitroreductase subunit ArsF family protein [Methanolinea sp.]|nr:nitrophenyl compound nitroreductase subunit ArsF family protein [Methanolinea sp.]